MKKMVTYALRLADAGYRVLPVHHPKGKGCSCDDPACDRNRAKHPITDLVPNGFLDATRDKRKIRGWYKKYPDANVGLVIPEGLFALDVDPRKGGRESLEALGPLPRTVTSKTGGKGAHFIFRVPDGYTPDMVFRFGKGLDSKPPLKGYIVAPPSKHISGGRYEWAKGRALGDIEPAPMPPEFVTRFSTNGHGPLVEVDFTADDVDADDVLRDAVERDLPGRDERRIVNGYEAGADRSEDDFGVVCALVRADADDDGIRAIFAKFACGEKYREPGEGDRYLERTIQRARAENKHFIRDRGFENLQFFTAQELVESTPEEVDWAVRPYLVYGTITELVGRVKWAGKTTFALAMVDAVLDGEPFLGEPTQRSPVVFASEQPRASLRVQIQRAGLDAREDLHLLSHVDALAVKWPKVAEQIGERAEEVGARVVVVDTLSRFAKLRGEEEQASGHAAAAMEPLEALAAKGLAVLVVRHERKGGGDVGESGRGSSAFAGAVDIVLRLRRREGNQTKSRVRVIDAASRFEETPEKLVIELSPSGEYIAHGSEEALAEEEAKLAITSALHDGGTMERQKLRGAIPKEVSDSTLYRAVSALVEDGTVRREKGGGKKGTAYRYSITIEDGDGKVFKPSISNEK